MAAGVTTSANITKARKLFVAAAIFTHEHKDFMPGLIDRKTLPSGMGVTWNEPYWPTLVAQGLTEGVEIVNPQQITDAGIVITPGEVGAQIMFTRKMARVISENFASVAGKLLGKAISVKRDQDLLALAATATTALGTTSTTASAHLIAAAANGISVGIEGTARTGVRDSGDPGEPPYHAVLHPYHRFDLFGQFSGWGQAPGATSAPSTFDAKNSKVVDGGMAAQTIRNGFAGQIAGVNIHFDGNMPIVDGSPDSVNASCFAKEGMVLVDFRELDTDQEWNARRRAWEWTSTMEYGYGVRADAWLRKLILDATAPST